MKDVTLFSQDGTWFLRNFGSQTFFHIPLLQTETLSISPQQDPKW